MVALATKPLFEDCEWTFDTLKRAYAAIEEIALTELGLDVYPNQIEVITAEQMLDAYSSIGMPLLYRHWSFGKRFAREESRYRRGMQGLAYELVINASPCVSYVMEENSMTMQALVIAHAAFGHNHFFKNNYLFRQWTDAESILDYLTYAKAYVAKCEDQHGIEAVESVLDGAHALMHYGVHRVGSRAKSRVADPRTGNSPGANTTDATTTISGERCRRLRRLTHPKMLPTKVKSAADREQLALPEENILFFLEQHAPKLDNWQRELLRVVQQIAQYFYPQRQTKVINEGTATFVHYEIMNRLYDRGLIGEGAMWSFCPPTRRSSISPSSILRGTLGSTLTLSGSR